MHNHLLSPGAARLTVRELTAGGGDVGSPGISPVRWQLGRPQRRPKRCHPRGPPERVPLADRVVVEQRDPGPPTRRVSERAGALEVSQARVANPVLEAEARHFQVRQGIVRLQLESPVQLGQGRLLVAGGVESARERTVEGEVEGVQLEGPAPVGLALGLVGTLVFIAGQALRKK